MSEIKDIWTGKNSHKYESEFERFKGKQTADKVYMYFNWLLEWIKDDNNLALLKSDIDKLSYNDFLSTNYWRDIRNYKVFESNFICSNCLTANENSNCVVHHLDYSFEKHLTHENLDKLTVLCRECHEKIHNSSLKKRNAVIEDNIHDVSENKDNYDDDCTFSTLAMIMSSTDIIPLFDKIYYNLRLTNPYESLSNDSYSYVLNQSLFAKRFGMSSKTVERLIKKLVNIGWIKKSPRLVKQCCVIFPQWKNIIKDVHENGGHLKPIWSNYYFEYKGRPTKTMTWNMMLEIAGIQK